MSVSTTWYFLTCSLRSTSVVNKSEKYRNVPSTFPCLTLQWPFLLTKRVCRLRSDTSWFGKSLETRGLSSVPFVMLYQDFYRVPKHLWPWPSKERQNFGVKSKFSTFNPNKHFSVWPDNGTNWMDLLAMASRNDGQNLFLIELELNLFVCKWTAWALSGDSFAVINWT